MSEPLYEKKFKVGMGEVKLEYGTIQLILCGVEGSKLYSFISKDEVNMLSERGDKDLEVRFSVHLAE